jgi:hypothetical protein
VLAALEKAVTEEKGAAAGNKRIKAAQSRTARLKPFEGTNVGACGGGAGHG